MTMKKQAQIKCPKCGKNLEFTVYDTINVDVNPELLEKVIEGELFIVECEGCGESYPLEYPVLYHDMDRKYMIQVSQGAMDVKEFVESLGEYDTLIPGYKFRFVSTSNELREKIFIFNLGLSDIVVEYLKLAVMVNFEEAEKVTHIFFTHKEVKDGVDMLLFDVFKGEESMGLGIPFDVYKQVEGHFPKDLGNGRDKESVVVDMYSVGDWMEKHPQPKKPAK